MKLDAKIEAILFFKNEPVSKKELAKILEVEEADIKEALNFLKNKLQDRGIRLLSKGDQLMLGTASDASEIIKSIQKEELSKDLGRASLETLSIILYQCPITKAEIDYIRGVNSSSILRNLLVRGLVERKVGENKQKKRGVFYFPTFDLLAFMGVSNLKELPEYEKVRREIKNLSSKEKDKTDNL